MGRKAAKKGKGYKSPPPGFRRDSREAGGQEGQLVPDTQCRDEMDDSLANIYESFYGEFCKRVGSRAGSEDPLRGEPLQRSALDERVKTQLVGKVQELARRGGLGDVYEMFEGRTVEYVERLLAGAKEHTDKRLRLGLLEDAFDFLENAIEVVEELIRASPSGTDILLRMGKSEFFRLIQDDTELTALLAWADTLTPSYAHGLYEERAQYIPDAPLLPCSCHSPELLESMSIEELVLFINEKDGPRRKKDRSICSTADTSTSPRTEQVSDEDREIEAFRKRLESMKTTYRKAVKPHISDEWLKRLSFTLDCALQSQA